MSAPTTNTGTRHFYTDPIAAAWQMKHHGMKLYQMAHVPTVDFATDEKSISVYRFPLKTWETINIKKGGIFLFLHPDSLRLLEPQEGDLICKEDLASTVYRGKNGLFASMPLQGAIVVSRNGKPFFWPEREEV